MALSGTLDTFALPDVLRLLGSTQKSGRLRVTGDRGSGSVWVDSGQVVATELTSLNSLEPTDIEVVFGLLRFTAGSFTFEADAVAPNAGSPMAMEPILGAAENMLAEWRSIEEIVPSLDVWVGLSAELNGPDVMIDATRWRCIAAIGSGAQVGSVAELLHMNEIDSCRVVKELVELGLVELVEEPAAAPALSEPILTEEPATSPILADTSLPSEAPADVVPVMDDYSDPVTAEPIGESPSFVDESLASDTFSDSFAAGPDPLEPDAIQPEAVEAPEPVAEQPADEVFAPTPQEAPVDASTEPSLASLTPSDEPSIDPLLPAGDPLESMGEPPMAPPAPLFEGGDAAPVEEDLDPAEMARQLANLSPKAAKAVAAAAKASTEAERDAALAAVEAEDESVNRGMLLKFLGSVDS